MRLTSCHKCVTTTLSFDGSTLDASQALIVGKILPIEFLLMFLAQDLANTMHSSKELLAILLAHEHQYAQPHLLHIDYQY